MFESIGPMLPWIRQPKKHKKTVIMLLLTMIAVFFVFFVPHVTFAQTDPYGLQSVGNTGLGSDDIRLIIAKIIRAALGLMGIIALCYFLYAGWLIMTAGGEEEKITLGKKTMINVVIGIIIILASYAIVQFIINSLSGQGSGETTVSQSSQIQLASFRGSGSLGQVVKDHYPFRDQVGVKRNTKISITFAEPVEPSSFIFDTNGTGGTPNNIFGDCTTATPFSWAVNCDRLNTSSIYIYRNDDETKKIEAAVSVLYEGVTDANNPISTGKVFTIVIQPLELLGSDTENVSYRVFLSDKILKKFDSKLTRQPSIFENAAGRSYFWDFQTDTLIDTEGPKILNVYPRQNTNESRNNIVQINFSEPIDPTTVQGLVGPSGGLSNIIFNFVSSAGVYSNTEIQGEWKISNGYKTVEFRSSVPCAAPNNMNSCGELMYCLPPSVPNNFAVLARTAALRTNASFEASLPYTGIVDMSGNALDGNGDGTKNGKPAMGNDRSLVNVPPHGDERLPDNYIWSFTIKDGIDMSVPYIERVQPGLDQSSVKGDVDVNIYFSKEMWLSTFFEGLKVEEYPASTTIGLWQRTQSEVIDAKTYATIVHREFGPGHADAYYFTSVSSSVKSLNQNCLYPGKGPVSSDASQTDSSPICNSDNQGSCVAVQTASNRDTGCVQTVSTTAQVQGSINDCVQVLRQDDISPVNRQ